MSSVNPLIVLPGAMRERGEAIAAGLHGSITLGAGQFCTKPGLIFVRDDEATDRLHRPTCRSDGGIAQSYTLFNRCDPRGLYRRH
jgi:NADP-dependent aldehyde dehydrogenase